MGLKVGRFFRKAVGALGTIGQALGPVGALIPGVGPALTIAGAAAPLVSAFPRSGRQAAVSRGTMLRAGSLRAGLVEGEPLPAPFGFPGFQTGVAPAEAGVNLPIASGDFITLDDVLPKDPVRRRIAQLKIMIAQRLGRRRITCKQIVKSMKLSGSLATFTAGVNATRGLGSPFLTESDAGLVMLHCLTRRRRRRRGVTARDFRAVGRIVSERRRLEKAIAGLRLGGGGGARRRRTGGCPKRCGKCVVCTRA